MPVMNTRRRLLPGTDLLLLCAIVVSCGRSGGEEEVTVDAYRDFGITANNAFFYYDDLEGATRFYTEVLGIDVAADYGFAKILHIAPTSYLTLVDAAEGMHSSSEPKTVAIALVTDQLDEWYVYLTAEGVSMRFDYNPVEGRPHHGFVVLDPEGYYLEFERFNDHPENELFMPILDRTATVFTGAATDQGAAGELGFKATILWLYYRDMDGMQRFYRETFGLDLLVDQGWAKIYQTSPSGYIGLVDETRGMHSFTEQKAVTLSFLTDNIQGWYDYAKEHEAFELRSGNLEETDRYRAFVGYDPEGYYLEFDTFLAHDDNRKLLRLLSEGR